MAGYIHSQEEQQKGVIAFFFFFLNFKRSELFSRFQSSGFTVYERAGGPCHGFLWGLHLYVYKFPSPSTV